MMERFCVLDYLEYLRSHGKLYENEAIQPDIPTDQPLEEAESWLEGTDGETSSLKAVKETAFLKQ